MKQIRESKFSKILAYYLMIMMFLQVTSPVQMYALTSGPTQPEFNSFTPIGTSDMVDLASGDFNYNIPVMDVGGYPVNLSYNSGITTDEEASWVGLGWNLNVGQIQRQVRGLPDDFNGDTMRYENDLRKNITVGTSFALNGAFLGWDGIKPGVGLGVEYNNYEGISFKPSFGVAFELTKSASVGLNFSGSVSEGPSVNPFISLSKKMEVHHKSSCTDIEGTGTIGLGFNSRKGVQNLNVSASIKTDSWKYSQNDSGEINSAYNGSRNEAIGGSISFNNQSYTPSKRLGFENYNFTFNAALGSEIMGPEIQGQMTGYGSYQDIAKEYKDRTEKAYGYENTHYKGEKSGVLDFNRENEKTVTKNTNILPVTNYTYDIYNIEGQGVSGMFRPYRSQVSYVYNDRVSDFGIGVSTGVEFGAANLVHMGFDFKLSPTISNTGGWFENNKALGKFKESNTDSNSKTYEPYTYKLVGSMVADPEEKIYSEQILGTHAMRVGIGGKNKKSWTEAKYYYNGNSDVIDTKIKRSKRYVRNQLVQKITAKEAEGDKFIEKNTLNAKAHHTAGYKVSQTDGSTYVYGNTAYNTTKVEATFDVSKKPGNNSTGLVEYNGSIRGNNTDNSDKFLNRITTPAYAHSYLLTSVLSSDYEDVDDNGPSISDLGTYTQFIYKTTDESYKWRVPFEENKAAFNSGLISNTDDEKGTYLYGEKELKYLDKIVTKTHVAFFDLEDRKDAIGVVGEHGGAGSGRMKKIKSIRLYSRQEVTNSSGVITDPGVNNENVKPIKTAHFVYSYSLCKGIPNNSLSQSLTESELHNYGGKLTLKKVYFTYRNSNMGKYTPYQFDYNEKDNEYLINKNNPNYVNPDCPNYNAKGFDVWGNYKKNPNDSGDTTNPNSPLSTAEFPFVEQNTDTANANAKVWSLGEIKLPSGGKITIDTESDDYQYVQNKKAMQMFKVYGCGDTDTPVANYELYDGNNQHKYLYVKLSDEQTGNYSEQDFITNYLGENYDKYIQFRFLMNMTNKASQYEYVSGYFQIDKGEDPITHIKHHIKVTSGSNGTIASIPLQFLKRDGGTNGSAPVNPIAKTGWGFGRTYLNRVVYGLGGTTNNTQFVSIVKDLVGSIKSISEIFAGPNKALQNKNCARKFNADKSWVRLENSNGKKLGGGLRVKSIKLSDQWENMLDDTGGTNHENLAYGQSYSYKDENEKSSGVATFEPNFCSENPWVEPFFPVGGNYAERIGAPKENNYEERPFGVNFFPASRVTYSRVEVKNLERKEGNVVVVKKHATGNVVTEHFTTRDFPTKVEQTDVSIVNDLVPNDLIGSLIKLANVSIRNHLALSQGFSIETNDMNGKIKSQSVYPENQTKAISKVEYKYCLDENGNLDNNLTTINSEGKIEKKLLGLDYDVINDFNQSYSATGVMGFDGNLAVVLYGIIPTFVATVIPKNSFTENQLRTAVTTKHVHRTAILKEKIVTDNSSVVSTKNLAWDANSGEVILTETINEYGDNYFSFTYPAYWMYEGMGAASSNIGIEGILVPNVPAANPNSSSLVTTDPYFKVSGYNENNGDLTKIFHLGDELYSEKEIIQSSDIVNVNLPAQHKLWVVGFSSDNKSVLLMDRNGQYTNKCQDLDNFDFKIVRSGFRNLQSATMSSVVSMTNPILNNDGSNRLNLDVNLYMYTGSSFNPKIVNSSAVEYNDFWLPQAESDLPYYPAYNTSIADNLNFVKSNGLPKYPYDIKVNPYVWNVKGEWRAQKSYAYLTGRSAGNGAVNNPRNQGFFTRFSPYYQLENGKWVIKNTDDNWTGASSITQFNPFGAELENKDALGRYSSAQYGYQYKLPMAVASNSSYNQMGYEGFEEVKTGSRVKHFGFGLSQNAISTKYSHTGKASIKVTKGNTIYLSRKLTPSVKTIALAQCPTPTSTVGNCGFTFNNSDFVHNYCIESQESDNYNRSIEIVFTSGVASIGAPVYNNQLGNVNLSLQPQNNQYGGAHNIYFCVTGGFANNGDTSIGNYFDLPVTYTNGTSCCIRIGCSLFQDGKIKLSAGDCLIP
ncbi:hypothetical protein [Flavobacterium sp.]|uniref:hypothetical protein n=1 Tax=Flavobacterium sp. TaxID=239 RepID=UPI003D6AB291